VVGDRRVGRQRQVGEHLAEEEPRTRVAIEQQRVLAAPAQAAVLRRGSTSMTGAESVKAR
jgi:hypothetical protein